MAGDSTPRRDSRPGRAQVLARSLLGWEPRDIADTIVATADTQLRQGLPLPAESPALGGVRPWDSG
ncbi:hypothetical protein EJC51_43385 [Streptomyces aquilus]|uniref:Uncharacterized protein n=1 Tax=Streptomyces aquilus TaxID=2548456 RepID=A0A3S9ID93_9ACTN|nr:hypothetical protein EJC51_43385 [Streptomyces aquilus]